MYTFNTPTSTFTLTKNDKNCIEFVRCLHKTKYVVEELQTFGTTVSSILNEPTLYRQNQINPEDFLIYVKMYLDGSIRKFNQSCRTLLLVLSTFESKQSVRKEIIFSFRQELIDEWEKAIGIKKDLLKLVENYDIDSVKNIEECIFSSNTADKDMYHDDDMNSYNSYESTPELISDPW
ncbi:unnamed protein product [Rhizopus stolonifer]